MNKKWGLSFLFFTVALACITVFLWQNRIYDWDLPGYLGAVYSWEMASDLPKVHSLVYSSIRAEASSAEFRDIIAYNYANTVFYKDYHAFGEQLPYYQVKFGYNLAIFTVFQFGISGPQSLFIVNFLSYFLCGIIMFFTIRNIFSGKTILPAILSLIIMVLPPMQAMVQNPTPDIFVLLFVLLLILGELYKISPAYLFILLLCCVLIRPDYIIFVLTYLAAKLLINHLLIPKKTRWSFIIQGSVLLAVYFFLLQFYHYPGWKSLFYDSFFYRRPVISAQPADFTWKQYWDFFIIKLINFKKITLSAMFLLAAVFYLSKNGVFRIFALVFFANIYLKYIFFPDSANLRFFIGFVILLFFVFLKALHEKYSREMWMQKIP